MNGSAGDSPTPSPVAFAAFELRGGNYIDWRFRMQMVLVQQNLWDVVAQHERPESVDAAEWAARSLRALAAISAHLTDIDVVHIRRCATAREAWELIADMYEPSGLVCQVFLSRELNATRLREGASPREHFARMAALAEQLETAGQPVPDDVFAWTLLASLPPSYAPLVKELGRRKKDITAALVMAAVLFEDERRRSERGLDARPPAPPTLQPYLTAPSSSASAEPRSRFSATSAGSSTPESDQPPSSATASDVQAHIFFPLAGPFRRDGWYLHSSVDHHLSPQRPQFARFEALPSPIMVDVAGTKYEAVGCGDIRVVWEASSGETHRVMMRDVYYVPAAPANFIAVAPLVEKGFGFAFRGGNCILERRPGEGVGRAVKEGGAYRLVTHKS